MAVAIKPLEDRIVVKASEAETTTASGLVIPDTAKEKPQEGTVVAVGPGRFDDGVRVPMDVKVGDVVLYSKYGGTEVKYNNEEYLVLSAPHDHWRHRLCRDRHRRHCAQWRSHC
jgi:chaperonin GroES